jgi:hypothetical protein
VSYGDPSKVRVLSCLHFSLALIIAGSLELTGFSLMAALSLLGREYGHTARIFDRNGWVGQSNMTKNDIKPRFMLSFGKGRIS